MRDERRIFTNTVVTTAVRGGADVCIFLFLISFARAYGPAVLGEYSLAMAIGAVLAILVSFGLNISLIRDLSRNPERGPLYVGNVLLIQLVFAVFVALLLIAIAMFMNLDTQARNILLLIGAYHIGHRLFGLSRAQFAAHEQIKVPAILDASHKVLILIFGTAVIVFGGGPLLALAIYPLSGLLLLLTGILWSVRSFGRPVLTPDTGVIVQRLRMALAFVGLVIVPELYARTGIFVLNAFHDEAVVGAYSAAERLTLVIAIGYGMFGAAALPVMSRLSAGPEDRLRELYARCQRVLVVLTLPAATLMFLLREPIVALVFGVEYQHASTFLGILASGLLLHGLNQLQTCLLLACNYQRSVLINSLLVLVLFLAATLWAVPAWGGVGLAVCTVIGNLLLFSLNQRQVARAHLQAPTLRQTRGALAACLAAAAAYYFSAGLSATIQVALTIVTGALCMWLFKAVEAHDFGYLRRMLQTT